MVPAVAQIAKVLAREGFGLTLFADCALPRDIAHTGLRGSPQSRLRRGFCRPCGGRLSPAHDVLAGNARITGGG